MKLFLFIENHFYFSLLCILTAFTILSFILERLLLLFLTVFVVEIINHIRFRRVWSRRVHSFESPTLSSLFLSCLSSYLYL